MSILIITCAFASLIILLHHLNYTEYDETPQSQIRDHETNR